MEKNGGVSTVIWDFPMEICISIFNGSPRIQGIFHGGCFPMVPIQWGYPQLSSTSRWDFPMEINHPAIEVTPIDGNPMKPPFLELYLIPLLALSGLSYWRHTHVFMD